MKREFKLSKGEKVREVYINGIRNLENEDYCIKNNKLRLNVPVENSEYVTIVKEITL